MSPHPVPETGHPGPISASEMDDARRENMAYEYLCHLEEARIWLQACLKQEMPTATELEEMLTNGVYLAKLAHFFAPEIVPAKKIFDPEFEKFSKSGLHFRHTDNINYFLQAVNAIGLPDYFTPETTDIYDKKNMPRVIFCLHALSLFLYKLGLAPLIQDLYGKATFTEAELSAAQTALEACDQPMPAFSKLEGILEGDERMDRAQRAKPSPMPMPKKVVEVPPPRAPTPPKAPVDFMDIKALVDFQARARGFLTRLNLYFMLQHYMDREDKVIKAQAIWRGILVRRKWRGAIEEALRRRPNFKSLSYYKRYERQIVTIQRNWRHYKNKLDFESLTASKEFSLVLVRKYLHLLDTKTEDFEQELQLQSLKGEITKSIRLNKQLEKDVDAMDIKIGLLVKNRLSVQDVVAHSHSITGKSGLQRRATFYHHGSTASSSTNQLSDAKSIIGLKALKKESREKLDAYQHLFYLLQTNPAYLARLVFVMPQMKTTKFLESVILTLYNFGSNQREEYLLLKLFKTALEEEVKSKVDKLGDIISGQPMVVKMVVSFNRNGKGQRCLRDILGPLISRVLEDKTLKISTNPVEIYKQWVNQLEFESGQSSDMPYDVTAEKAMEHEEVRKRLTRSITQLKQVATLFLTTIVKSKNKLPYGLLYMAKVLYSAIRIKFPSVPEKEILKVIGNLIYYRYINSAIVAPDACDVIEVNKATGEQALNNEQRKNLGSIAKVLQFAASKKGFGEESAHLMCLNQYIIESHEKLKQFFLECCLVPEPEEEFAMDQYTEATLIAKPVIYISLAEIVDTHQLLLDYQKQIAPDPSDPLHELLDDLGEEPSLCALLGAADPSALTESSLSNLSQTEVGLTLTNKFEFASLSMINAGALDTDKLFVKTKQLITSVLPCTKESNLLGSLKSKTSGEEAEKYWRLVEQKEQVEKTAENNKSMLEHTNLFQDDECALPLEECKRQILKNLQILERHGRVTKKDGFQAIITALGKDIVNQKQYRTTRRKEIFRLKNALKSMDEKRRFYEDQLECYNQYLKQCLANLQASETAGRRRKFVHFGRSSHHGSNEMGKRKLKSKQAIHYSGQKLHDKGVLLTIEGLPANQFKNVQFEFVPTEEDGIFEVHARFMGVRLEHVDVDIQELLKLQYEGVAVMNMFGKARINVNLLLHLLNVKFYGRK